MNKMTELPADLELQNRFKSPILWISLFFSWMIAILNTDLLNIFNINPEYHQTIINSVTATSTILVNFGIITVNVYKNKF